MKSTLQLFKKNITVVLLLLCVFTHAQQGINYQGVARNSEGNLMINETIDLEINIKKTTSDGTIVYGELHTVTTDINGVFSIIIGQGTATAIPYDSVDWAEDKHYLNVWLNGTDVGTTQFVEVPYAYAMGKWQAHKNGVMPKGTGGSIYIGENAGENDDFSNNNNIGIGENVLKDITAGSNNIGFGSNALQRVTTGNNNIGIGGNSLENTTTGHTNIALGFDNLKYSSTGFRNIAIGYQVLRSNISGGSNIAFGFKSLFENTTGHTNIALGDNSLGKNTTGGLNIALGSSALGNNTNGTHNIGMGHLALVNNTSGSYNIATGYRPLFNNTIGINNIAIGRDAMHFNTMGGNNLALGFNSLYSNTTGGGNISLGGNSLYSNTTGDNNLALGDHSLYSNTTGFLNTAIGQNTLRNNTSGNFNAAVGTNALLENLGNKNTAIGYASGFTTKGDGNVFIGYFAGTSPVFENMSDILVINTDADSNPLIYGEFDNDILGFNAKVGIGTKSPIVPLQIKSDSDANLLDGSGAVVIGDVNDNNLVLDNNEIQARENGTISDLNLQTEGGNVRVGGAIVHASDKRLKKEIVNISHGLQDILKLRPTEYFWKGKEQKHKSLGLIAQEVDAIIKNVVTYDKEQDKYGVSYTELIPVLIKAIQEQQNIIRLQEQQNNKQSKELSGLESRIQIIETKISQLN